MMRDEYLQSIIDLCVTVGLSERADAILADPDAQVDPHTIRVMAISAKREIMMLRAERERARMDKEDENFTTEDSAEAAMMPAAPFLRRALATYAERRGRYGASEQKFADVALAFFPHGLHLSTRPDWLRFGIFVQMMSKLCRYTNDWTDPHVDSIHDLQPYAAMLEAEDRRHLRRPPFNFVVPPEETTR
jgi:hypothetical protein